MPVFEIISSIIISSIAYFAPIIAAVVLFVKYKMLPQRTRARFGVYGIVNLLLIPIVLIFTFFGTIAIATTPGVGRFHFESVVPRIWWFSPFSLLLSGLYLIIAGFNKARAKSEN